MGTTTKTSTKASKPLNAGKRPKLTLDPNPPATGTEKPSPRAARSSLVSHAKPVKALKALKAPAPKIRPMRPAAKPITPSLVLGVPANLDHLTDELVKRLAPKVAEIVLDRLGVTDDSTVTITSRRVLGGSKK
jgi:hypothetical protein